MKTFIIDANNVLHRDPAWRAALAGAPSSARTVLVEALAPYARRYSAYAFLLVFDGESGTATSLPRNVAVRSASAPQTADDVIKHEIRSLRTPENCIVVSSDTEVYNAARAHACTAMTADEFIREIRSVLSPPPSVRTGSSGGEKPSGVSRAEIAAMKKLFGLE